MTTGYTYRASVKSDIADELINTYVMRPIAGVLVRALYRTRVSPNQVTIAAALSGCVAAVLYVPGDPLLRAIAGLCLTSKDILDSADGQLARAKSMFSRAGRFLDSLGDIAVNFAVCAANAFAAMAAGAGVWVVPMWGAAFLGMTLRVSYHVFYQASYLHLHDIYLGNRTSEEVKPEDEAAGGATLALQRAFQFLYGWQDRWMASIDRWCRQGVERSGGTDERWYADERALRLSGFLGLGTELFLFMLCSVAGAMTLYLWINLVLMNALWGVCIWYRRGVLRGALSAGGRPS